VRKKIISLAVAVLVIGGLLGAYFGLEARAEREAAIAAEERLAELAVSPVLATTQIQRSPLELMLAVFTNDGHSFTLEQSLDENMALVWKYERYPDLQLNNQLVQNMLNSALNFITTSVVVEEVDNPQDFGIGTVEVQLYFFDDESEIIRLGNMTPDRSSFYAMIEGDPALYLVTLTTGRNLSLELSDLLEREMIFVDEFLLEYVYLQERDQPPIEFAVKGTEEEILEMIEGFGVTWLTMVQPFYGMNLNFTNFQSQVLESFRMFEAAADLVEFFPEDLAIYGLDEPALTFIMEDVWGNLVHLYFGDEHSEQHRYMMFGDRPHVFLADRWHTEVLFGLSPFNFIERFVALVQIVEVDRIDIISQDRGNYNIIINNYEDEAERPQIAPIVNGQEVQDRAFRQFYQILLTFFYEYYLGEQDEDVFTQPDVIIIYHKLDGGTVEVQFFNYDANFYAARVYPEPVRFLTSRTSLDSVFNTLPRILAGELDR